MRRGQGARLGWYWLLVVPYVAMLWAPSFNKLVPSLGGVPFFYWYQFVWIALTAAIVGIVYALAHPGDRA
jgi:Protein of unknown function (DUF3311)